MSLRTPSIDKCSFNGYYGYYNYNDPSQVAQRVRDFAMALEMRLRILELEQRFFNLL